jgi:hypothetical protein
LPRLRTAAQHLLADAEHRVLVRGPRDPAGQEGRNEIRRDRLPLDAAVVPGLLLLVARDLLAYDPPRVLAWRLLHDPRLAIPWWLMPRLPAEVDRDPIALVLGSLAAALAVAYLVACLRAARPAVRAALLGVAALVLVVAPTLAFVAMGAATGRPYGQDGFRWPSTSCSRARLPMAPTTPRACWGGRRASPISGPSAAAIPSCTTTPTCRAPTS